MSNEQQHDDIVSAAYKDLAKEHTPEHLDQQVLAMAAGSVKRPSYSRWISWARPVAWAATITLCLAITFELARQPEVQPAVTPASSVVPEPRMRSLVNDPLDDQHSDEAQLGDDKPGSSVLAKDRDLEKTEAPEIAEERARWSAADTELQQQVADSIADTAAEKASVLRSAAPEQAEPQPADEPAGARRQAPDDYANTASVLEMNRAEQSSVAAGIAMAGDSDAASMVCPKERRTTAESWYKCILELRDAGEQVAAKREQESLVDTFPDFKLP